MYTYVRSMNTSTFVARQKKIPIEINEWKNEKKEETSERENERN